MAVRKKGEFMAVGFAVVVGILISLALIYGSERRSHSELVYLHQKVLLEAEMDRQKQQSRGSESDWWGGGNFTSILGESQQQQQPQTPQQSGYYNNTNCSEFYRNIQGMPSAINQQQHVNQSQQYVNQPQQQYVNQSQQQYVNQTQSNQSQTQPQTQTPQSQTQQLQTHSQPQPNQSHSQTPQTQSQPQYSNPQPPPQQNTSLLSKIKQSLTNFRDRLKRRKEQKKQAKAAAEELRQFDSGNVLDRAVGLNEDFEVEKDREKGSTSASESVNRSRSNEGNYHYHLPGTLKPLTLKHRSDSSITTNSFSPSPYSSFKYTASTNRPVPNNVIFNPAPNLFPAVRVAHVVKDSEFDVIVHEDDGKKT